MIVLDHQVTEKIINAVDDGSRGFKTIYIPANLLQKIGCLDQQASCDIRGSTNNPANPIILDNHAHLTFGGPSRTIIVTDPVRCVKGKSRAFSKPGNSQ